MADSDRDDPLAEIAELPNDVAALAAQLVTASRRIPVAAVDRWFPSPSGRGPLGESFEMSAARMQWRVFFKRRSGTTLFGFRIGGNEWVPLDASVSAQVRPVRKTNVPDVLPLQAELPDYLVANPTDAQLAEFAPAGATADNSVLLRVGPAILGILITADFRRSRLKIDGLEWPRSGVYPLGPLMDAVDALVAWRDRGMPVDGDSAFALPPASGARPVREVVDALSDAYLQCQRTLSQPIPGAFSGRRWEVTGYEAEATLRLRANGELARNSGEERFRLVLAARTEGRRDPLLRISATTTDIASDALVQATIDDIRFVNVKLGRLARGLDVHVASAQFFLDSSRATARAVLLGRNDGATHVLLVLRGELAAEPTAVLARMLFRLRGTEESPRAEFLHEEGFDLIKIPIVDIPSTTLRSSSAEWFLGIFANLRKWQDLLV